MTLPLLSKPGAEPRVTRSVSGAWVVLLHGLARSEASLLVFWTGAGLTRI